jgi:hypothetical protein
MAMRAFGAGTMMLLICRMAEPSSPTAALRQLICQIF